MLWSQICALITDMPQSFMNVNVAMAKASTVTRTTQEFLSRRYEIKERRKSYHQNWQKYMLTSLISMGQTSGADCYSTTEINEIMCHCAYMHCAMLQNSCAPVVPTLILGFIFFFLYSLPSIKTNEHGTAIIIKTQTKHNLHQTTWRSASPGMALSNI